MADTQRPLLLLVLVLLLKPGAVLNPVISTGVNFSLAEENSSLSPLTSALPSSSTPSEWEASITHASTPSSETDSIHTSSSGTGSTHITTPTSGIGSPHLSSNPGTTSTSPQPETISHQSSGSPFLSSSSPPTPTSLSPTSLTPQQSSTSFSLETHPPSTVSSLTFSPSSLSGLAPAEPEVPELHRNPGVVVAVCLLVSVLITGSMLMAVRWCRQGDAAFQRLDERPMNERSSFAQPSSQVIPVGPTE